MTLRIVSSVRSFWLPILLGLALPLAAAGANHEAKQKAWDEDAVEATLVKLAQETSKMKDGLTRHVDEAEVDSARRLVLSDVYEIHHRVISLQSGVRSGLGRDGTEPVFRRLLGSVRNARRDAQKFPEIDQVRSHIDAANELLDELEGYYGIQE
jgi:hypothetical protein